jgi:chromosome segregation ATPase
VGTTAGGGAVHRNSARIGAVGGDRFGLASRLHDQAMPNSGGAMAEKSETKELLQRRLETQLREWSTRIDHLEAEAERDTADAELREEIYEKVQSLRDKHAAAMSKLDDLKHSGEKAWRSVKKDIDRLWSDIQHAFENVTAGRRRARR